MESVMHKRRLISSLAAGSPIVRYTWIMCSLVTFGAVACSKDDGMSADCAFDEERYTSLTATQGLTPVFRWCGRPVDFLLVEDTDPTNAMGDVWSVECGTSVRCMLPPVTFGVPPAGTTVRQEVIPLQPDTEYRLCLIADADLPLNQITPTDSACLEFTT